MSDRVKKRAAVRTIVESVLRSGNLLPGALASSRLVEGIRGHQAIQRESTGDIVNEHPVNLRIVTDDLELTVYGRIDRLHGLRTVEEIKTTLTDPSLFADAHEAHWAQAMLYAHMLAVREGLLQLDVCVSYYDLNTEKTTTFTRHETAESLADFFISVTEPYIAHLEAELEHARCIGSEIKTAPFPFPAYRENQRKLAANCYVAIRDDRLILAQAPTGTGKTAAVLYPAIKALGEGLISRVFYLTARTTTQQAAVGALTLIKTPHLRSIVITSKEKSCILDSPSCDECPRAIGYYDRLGAAMSDISVMGGIFDKERIAIIADKYKLCPFELSLDASLLCDVIICDYNYAFDPRVKLIRYFVNGRGEQTILVDECHNLPSRSRDMYSARLSLSSVAAMKKTIPPARRRSQVYKAIRELEKAIVSAVDARAADDMADGDDGRWEGTSEVAPPESVIKPVMKLSSLLSEEDVPGDAARARELAFELISFSYTYGSYSDRHVTLYEGRGHARSITVFCTDASAYLAEVYKRCRGGVLFSATLSPMEFYRQLSGMGESAMLSLPSPFPPENLLCLCLPLSTRYRHRADTMEEAAYAAARFVASRTRGNFMIFLPSFAYMERFADDFLRLCPEADTVIQQRSMDDAARAEFIDGFSPVPEGLHVGLCVMGGVFAEGIDLPADRLIGVVIVGAGIPQVGLERNVLRRAYDDEYGGGYEYAYVYPGICKVLQAAGRMIRSETDRGALLLIDDRYLTPAYDGLLPPSWNVISIEDGDEAGERAAAFWDSI